MDYGWPAAQQHQPSQMTEKHLELDEAAFEQAFVDAKHAVDETESKDSKKEKVNEAIQPKFNMSFACTDPGDVMGEYDFDQHASTLGLEASASSLAQSLTAPEAAREDLGVHDMELPQELPKIGSDTIPAESGLNPQAESDELARTAGKLLDTLKEEQSSKFQNSAFLGLMRQLRDREVRIEGDQVVSVSTN